MKTYTVAVIASIVALTAASPHRGGGDGASGTGPRGAGATGQAKPPEMCSNKWIGYEQEQCERHCGIWPSGLAHTPPVPSAGGPPPMPTGKCGTIEGAKPSPITMYPRKHHSHTVTISQTVITPTAIWTCGGCQEQPTTFPEPSHNPH
ncbi:MAG: hypothetical protein Q9227_004706 [Pyrenula ochraceoflavens]